MINVILNHIKKINYVNNWKLYKVYVFRRRDSLNRHMKNHREGGTEGTKFSTYTELECFDCNRVFKCK